MRALVGAAVLLAGRPAAAYDRVVGDVPVSRLSGGGPAATDCLATVEVTGVVTGARAPTVTCEDGDHKRSLKFVSDLYDLAGDRVSRSDDIADPDDGSEHL